MRQQAELEWESMPFASTSRLETALTSSVATLRCRSVHRGQLGELAADNIVGLLACLFRALPAAFSYCPLHPPSLSLPRSPPFSFAP